MSNRVGVSLATVISTLDVLDPSFVQDTCELEKLVASDGAGSDEFGSMRA